MFGVSFLEIALVGLVALVVVGPQKLPEMMRTAGEWLGRLRRMTADMRAQTGIDDILREEGIDGVAELRTLLRGERGLKRTGSVSYGYDTQNEPPDPAVEFPVEGPDAKGALPDDLLNQDSPVTPPSEGPGVDSAVASAPPSADDASLEAGRAEVKRPPAPSVDKNPFSSLPPPPASARRLPPRAETHRETPKSKSDPQIAVSTPPPAVVPARAGTNDRNPPE